MTQTTPVIELLSENPELLIALTVLLRIARAYQNELTWSEYRTLHRFKRGVIPVLYLFTRGRFHLLSEKGGRDDAEYVTTVNGTIREVVRDLRRAGASLHLINSIKRRPDIHGDPLTSAHVVWYAENGEQVEGYLFRNNDTTVDLYAHTETSTADPLGHLTDPQRDGDQHDVVPKVSSH